MKRIIECPVCSGAEFKHVDNCIDYTVSSEQFTIEACKACGFILTNPQPDSANLANYYISQDYISHTNKANSIIDRLYLIARQYTLRWKKNIIHRNSSGRDLLDFGCGTGSFIQYMQTQGWNTFGFEPSPAARKIAQHITHNDVFSDIAELNESMFDVITLWHVLEHVPDLNQTIETLKKHLSTNGIILIAVPNHDSPDRKKYKANWAAYDVPRHLWHFNQHSLQHLFLKHGLRIVKTIPMKLDSYYISLLSEKYKNGNKSSFFHLPKAFIAGLMANISASRSNNYSSLIYIIKK
ncbi:class I SAM-dependent methyltransferase [Pseudochryseolinea flava]|uniref:Methyltransferase n=1 Tax=Pseudochryseolinea flava TaxID=2059302 RepID=A0A364Y7S6_9BACT|nr:class I SAM-dependent methyltransferase [Pseudochryseolinea flava]RAW03166.1 methyltransferase [Pseudochryseolinea flava]